MYSTEESKELLLRKIEEKEIKAKKRILLYTSIPIITAIILIIFTSYKVFSSLTELNKIQQELSITKAKTDTLDTKLIKTISSLSKIVSATHKIEGFIESKESYLRSIDEANFLINVRRLFDEINIRYSELSYLSSVLSHTKNNRIWITVVSSSKSLNKLKEESVLWISEYGKSQVAIYKASNNFYALSLIGDGTFTKAYDLTVDLQKTGKAYDAYFAESKDWGENLLK